MGIIHSKRPLRRKLDTCQKTAVLWLRTYVLVLVLTYSPEYSLPQPRKLIVFGTAPNPMAMTLAPQDTDTTIGKLRMCTNVQRDKVRSVVRFQHRRPAPANQLQIHVTKYEAPGPLTLATNSRLGNRRYFNQDS